MKFFIFGLLFIQIVLGSTIKQEEEELCDFDCFIQNLKLNISLGDSATASFLGYNLKFANLEAYNLNIKEITGTSEPEGAPTKFQATILFETLSIHVPVQNLEDNNVTVANIDGTLHMATLGISVGFSTYDYAGYNLIAETDPHLILDLNMGDAELSIEATDEASFWGSLLASILDTLLNWFKKMIASILSGQIEKVDEQIKIALDDVFYGINKNYTERYINQTHPVQIPIYSNLMNLTETSLIDMLAWATTSLLGGNTTLSLNELITRFTKGTGTFVVGTREDTFENLSDIILDALKFENITVPDLNATLGIGLSYLELTGLNTWRDLQLFDPVRYSTQLGTNIPYCEIDSNCDYQVLIASGLEKLGIKLKFSINVTAESETISLSGKMLHEEANFKVDTADNYMEGRLQLALYDGEFENYSQNMMKNMTCWKALVSFNETGIPTIMLNTSISKIELSSASAYLETGIQDIINAVVDVFLYTYAPAIPSFLNGLLNEYGVPAINTMLQNVTEAECEEDPDPQVLEYKPVAVVTTTGLVIFFGGLLAIIAILVMLTKLRREKEGRKKVYSFDDTTVEYSYETSSSEERMRTIQDETVSETISSSDDDEVFAQIEEMSEDKKQKKEREKKMKKEQEKEKRKRKRGFFKKLICSPVWFFRQFGRTDPEGTSMFLDDRIPIVVRIIVPIICFINMALFVISNSGTGAVVNAYILFADNNHIKLPFSDFGLIDSVTDMWEAGVYPLSILIMVFSGIWPYVKLVMLLWAWMMPSKLLSSNGRGKILHFLDYFGKWSFLDSYVMTLMIVAFYFDVPLPIAHENAVDLPFGIKLYVDAALGFVLLMTATMVSLLLSHIVVFIHNHILADKSDDYGREAKKFKPLMMYCKTWWARIVVLAGIILSGILVIVGLFIRSFAFDFYGLAGWALGILGENTHRNFSLMDLGLDLPESSRDPNGFNTIFVQAIYMLTVVVLPLLHHVFLLIYWLVPLNRKIQYIIHSICDILYAWACMDVFIISVIAAVLELSQFAGFMVEPMCSAPIELLGGQTLDDIIALFFGEENLIKGHETCFEVAASLEGGCWCLFISVIIYSFVALGITRFGRKQMIKRKPTPDEKDEFYQNEALKKADVKPLLYEEN